MNSDYVKLLDLQAQQRRMSVVPLWTYLLSLKCPWPLYCSLPTFKFLLQNSSFSLGYLQ